jgi:hypothetical protein
VYDQLFEKCMSSSSQIHLILRPVHDLYAVARQIHFLIRLLSKSISFFELHLHDPSQFVHAHEISLFPQAQESPRWTTVSRSNIVVFCPLYNPEK